MIVVAAHPAAVFGDETARLLAGIAGVEARCVDVTAAPTFDAMIDELEAARRRAGIDRWLFWGMSGGGWLAQLYARRHPEALEGIIVESACVCFRERLRDPSCAIGPFFPAWRNALESVGAFDARALDEPFLAGAEHEWIHVDGVGQVYRRRGGGALVVSPAPIDDVMKRNMPVLLGFDARSWLPAVELPALVIAGDADPVVPVARVRAVHDALRGSTFVLVPGGGHVPSASNAPAAVDAIRVFVAGLG